jgi:hypothetical protein
MTFFSPGKLQMGDIVVALLRAGQTVQTKVTFDAVC